ncbi:MAG: hypothetical protein EBS90_13200 [Betaproteobacteria bacterium]|nr:hypothetical protein [Betaproteobacteria bacterium]
MFGGFDDESPPSKPTSRRQQQPSSMADDDALPPLPENSSIKQHEQQQQQTAKRKAEVPPPDERAAKKSRPQPQEQQPQEQPESTAPMSVVYAVNVFVAAFGAGEATAKSLHPRIIDIVTGASSPAAIVELAGHYAAGNFAAFFGELAWPAVFEEATRNAFIATFYVIMSVTQAAATQRLYANTPHDEWVSQSTRCLFERFSADHSVGQKMELFMAACLLSKPIPEFEAAKYSFSRVA